MNSSEEEQIYSIALTMVPGIGHIGAKHLMDEAGSAGSYSIIARHFLNVFRE